MHALAEEIGLPLFTPPNAKDEDFLSALEEMQPDLCITAAYGCFLPRRFLDIPAHGTLNIHPSLLPKYRGAAPLQRCLEAGDAVGGVSVLFTVLKMDAGPRPARRSGRSAATSRRPSCCSSLRARDRVLDALPSVWDGRRRRRRPRRTATRRRRRRRRDITEAELASPRLGRATRTTACALSRAGRGRGARCASATATPSAPSSAAPASATRAAAAAGTVALSSDGKALELSCGDGSVLEVLELTLPGKKPVGPKAFWNGLNGRDDVAWVEA